MCLLRCAEGAPRQQRAHSRLGEDCACSPLGGRVRSRRERRAERSGAAAAAGCPPERIRPETAAPARRARLLASLVRERTDLDHPSRVNNFNITRITLVTVVATGDVLVRATYRNATFHYVNVMSAPLTNYSVSGY